MPGRVLSKANEQKIRDALSALKGMLSFLEDDDEKDEEEQEKESAPMVEAAIDGDVVPLVEQALRGDGTVLLKLIQPGWGSSGFYPREVLERDGPQVFKKGTKQYWNHPTAAEEAMRPEGDLNALAAELVSDARYEWGPAGEGLYADAKVFGPYQTAINELSPHIGVSIRAAGKATQGKAEGREGPIIQAITSAQSADFVTVAGAGGEIIRMFEAARHTSNAPSMPAIQEESMSEDQQKELQELKEAVRRSEQDNARLREQMVARDARDQVREALAATTLPQVAQTRLLVRLSANPPLKEGSLDSAQLSERINGAVAEERQYLEAVAGYGSGRIEGMGSFQQQADPQREQTTKNLAESLERLGLGKAMAAEIADEWR